MKVLIADDNSASCKLLRALLEAHGHAVIVAADGREALELLERYPVDAIISDLLMPNLDGFRLCREIRQDSRWHRTPFICYTAIYCSLDDEKLALDLGADAYLRKPLHASNAVARRVSRLCAFPWPPSRQAEAVDERGTHGHPERIEDLIVSRQSTFSVERDFKPETRQVKHAKRPDFGRANQGNNFIHMFWGWFNS
jgi:CheY-like chemotaxis protein